MSEPVWVPLGAAAGRRERIPIRLRVPRSSTLGGNAAFSVSALTAHDFAVWEFANNVEGRVYGYVVIPPSLAVTPTPEVRLVCASAVAAGNMLFGVKTLCVNAGQSFNPASLVFAGSFQPLAAAGIWGRVDGTFPLGEAVAPRGMLLVEISRAGADGTDTAEGTAYLIEAYLEVTLGP